MAYNRWMPHKYYSGGELYHYGVKGMRWKNHKSPLQAAYDVAGGAAEQEWHNAVDNMDKVDFSDPRQKAEYWEKQRRFATSPVGRVKIFKDRIREIHDDVAYDDSAKTRKQKGKLLVKYLIDYIKNG